MGNKQKVELSPRLKLGIGLSQRINFWQYGSATLLILSGILALRAGYMVFTHSSDTAAAPKPQVLGASDTKTVTFIDYTVTKGDTLFNISQKYNVSWSVVATINNLEPPFNLKSGQKLKIPQN
jgi:LysM repeat protein